ncbi:MAG: flagellar hook-length control protein FliK, partial [Syntrophales bacterium]
RQDGDVAVKLTAGTAVSGNQDGDIELQTPSSSLELPAGKLDSELAQTPVRDYADAKTASSQDRGIFAAYRSGEALVTLTTESSRNAGAVLAKDQGLNEAVPKKNLETPISQTKVDLLGIINPRAGEASLSSSQKLQKVREIFPNAESAVKAAASDIVETNSYNVGRQFFSADISAPAEGRNLANQVMSQLPEGALRGSSRVRINLYPESLGSVDMDIVVRENRVHVFIIAERADVVQALQGQQEQLKNALQSQGLQVNSLDFQLRENPNPMNDGSRGGDLWRHQNQERGQKEGKNYEAPVLSGSLGALTGNIMHNSQMDRTISIFV